jgi:hypothetical protein
LDVTKVNLYQGRPIMVRIEPNHHLHAMNGNSRRGFKQVGECLHNGCRKAVIKFTDANHCRKIALVSMRCVLPLPSQRKKSRKARTVRSSPY